MSSSASSTAVPPSGENRIDLDAYLERIGYTGPRAATLDTLKALHLLHPQAIAFENLDPFLGKAVELGLGSLQAKLVRSRRGGYCYEQNLLFKTALEAMGFNVAGLAARVLWGRPEDAITARTHMLLRVKLDGRTWLADVGFGGLTQTAPLLFESGREQDTPHERFRVIHKDGYHHVQAEVAREWRSLYRFDLSEQHETDYAVASYYVSTNPASHFVTGLIAARAMPGRRLALAGNRLTVHDLSGKSERSEIGTADELAEVLEREFDLEIPDRAAFERAARDKGLFAKPRR